MTQKAVRPSFEATRVFRLATTARTPHSGNKRAQNAQNAADKRSMPLSAHAIAVSLCCVVVLLISRARRDGYVFAFG